VVQDSYEIGPWLVGVRTNSEAFGRWLDDTIGAYRTAVETDPYYSVLVAEEDDGRPGKSFHILYRETTALIKSFDLRAVVQMLLAELDSLLAHDREDAIYADAALVASNGVTGLVLPSLTAPYLTALGRHVEKEIALPLRLQVAIDPDTGLAVPIEPKLAVDERALDALGAIVQLNGRHERLVVERPAEVDVVCAVGLAEEALTPLSEAQTVFRLAQQAVNLGKLGERGLVGLARLAERARCYEVRTANVRDTLASLLLALRSAD
jgi:hypothetical protein